MNKHLHPLSVEARRLLRTWIQERQKEREKEMESWRRSTGKGWQMEGWINVEMNQQQSNKATARFLGSSHNSSDLFPPWHNYHSPPNYFFFLYRFLMAGCVFYDHVCKVEVLRAVVQPCRFRLCPQTAQEGGRGRRGRRRVCVGGVVGGCLWRIGQAPDQHFPGPVTVPEYSWHVCTVCERKWQTDLGVCFVSPSIVFCWYPGSSSSYLNTTKYYENTHSHTHRYTQKNMHTPQRMKQFLCCPHPHLHLQNRAGIWGLNTTRQMTTGHFTYSFITSHWFIPVYLFISWKKKFPLDCFAKSLRADVLSEKLSGSR